MHHEPNDEQKMLIANALTPDTAKMLRGLSDEGLAAWQTGWKTETAKYLLAEREWARRTAMTSAKSSRMAAWIGVCGTILGVFTTILGAWIAKALGLM